MELPAALALEAANRLLAQDNVNLPLFQATALRCRQIGALDQSRRLYQRVLAAEPSQYVEAIVSVLQGRGLPAGYPSDQVAPTPFVQISDFLPEPAHAEVLRLTSASLGDFVPSLYHSDGHGRLDVSQRVSAILPDAKPHAEVLRPFLISALQQRQVGQTLDVDVPHIRQEIQVTCSGNGAFFKPHTDSGTEVNKSRRLTFVYYFNFEPKQFTGGNLLLFDAARAARVFRHGAYTAIEPIDNSIVFFPSEAVHEVERVNAQSNDLRAGRFTINGWLHY